MWITMLPCSYACYYYKKGLLFSGDQSDSNKTDKFYQKAAEFYQKNMALLQASSSLNMELDKLKSTANKLADNAEANVGDT